MSNTRRLFSVFVFACAIFAFAHPIPLCLALAATAAGVLTLTIQALREHDRQKSIAAFLLALVVPTFAFGLLLS